MGGAWSKGQTRNKHGIKQLWQCSVWMRLRVCSIQRHLQCEMSIFPACRRNTLTPAATQSSTWRQFMELPEHMQNDLPWHKRGHYTFCRSSHGTKMCEFVFWINCLSLCLVSVWSLLAPWQTSQQNHQGNTGRDNLLFAWIQDNSETKDTPESRHPTSISL